MRVGFTGSRLGMNEMQSKRLIIAMHRLGATELHHGDCQGADKQAHEVGRMLGLKIVGHPPVADGLRAFCVCDELRPARPFLERDLNIVLETEFLLATPDGPWRPRSGTWTTVGYAKKSHKPCGLILPSGAVEFHPNGSTSSLFS